MFTKILIANRGEIACRVMRTARAMGIATVAVYSDADTRALHVRSADEAVRIGGPLAWDSYLNIPAIIAAAKQTGAQGIHPGYGFLSENADFARACAAAGIIFIGPTPQAIEAMGLKDRAKKIMAEAGVPVVPGYQGDDQSLEKLAAEAKKIGVPVLIKAVAGGGGKGMRLVERDEDFADALASCQREAKASFGNDRVLVEKYVNRPRHVEVQVFGDSHGNAAHLFERDCSLQRRHQKVVEEAPAPGLPDKIRDALGAAAVKAAKAIGYQGAGTIEFIMDAGTFDFYFMEMNTRLQVEHPVTEEITGLDLVEWQLRVASGEKLPLTQGEIKHHGHAFEVRLYAEDPGHEFLPQTGRITALKFPAAARIETGITEGDSVTIFYDPMIAKIVTHGETREQALFAMQAALKNTILTGLRTNQEFLSNIFAEKDFADATVDTGFIPRHLQTLLPEDYGAPQTEDYALVAFALMMGDTPDGPWAADGWRLGGAQTRHFAFTHRGGAQDFTAEMQNNDLRLTIGGKTMDAHIIQRQGAQIRAAIDGHEISGAVIPDDAGGLTIFRQGRVIALRPVQRVTAASAGEGRMTAPMPGRVVAVLATTGQKVTKNQPVLVMEAMKMEITIRAPVDGVMGEVLLKAGDQVTDGATIAVIGVVS